jgi:hypothetical protein
MATLFVKRGYWLLDDNIVAIEHVDGKYMVHPGSQVIKLPDVVLQKPEYSFVTPGPFLPALRKYAMNVRRDLLISHSPQENLHFDTWQEKSGNTAANGRRTQV